MLGLTLWVVVLLVVEQWTDDFGLLVWVEVRNI